MQRTPPRKTGNRARGCGFTMAIVALILGIVVPLAIAPVGAVLIFLIFTIPLYAILAVLPTLSLILLGTLIPGRLIRRGPVPHIAGGLLTLAALLYIPFTTNPAAHQKARDLIAGDKLTTPAPVRTGNLALIHPAHAGHRPEQSLCGDLCRTLLLEGRAKKVIIATDADVAAGFKPDLKAVAYSLESRPVCPVIGKPAYDLPGENTTSAIGQSSAERLDLAMVQGRCLVAQTAVTGEADIAAVYGDIEVRRDTQARWFRDAQFTTRRIGLWRRNAAAFEETYRHTWVAFDVYFPILAPTILLDGMTSHAGFARLRKHARPAEHYADHPPVADLLLGPPAAYQPGKGIPAKTQVVDDSRQVLVRALDATDAPSPAVLAVAKSYFDGMAWNRRDIAPQDAALATRLLTDKRFPVTYASAGFVKNGPSAVQATAIADSMFARLRAMETTIKPLALTEPQSDEAAAIGNVIEQLPAADILRHRADLLWLTHQTTLRAPAYSALSRLDLVGDGSEFLYLIDDSAMFTRPRDEAEHNYRQHPYLAGIKGLCNLGAKAPQFRPALIARIENGTISRNASYGDIAFNALVAMDTPYDDLARLFKGSSNYVRESYKDGRKTTRDLPIRPAYERAQRRKDCSY
ncbi:hypothetical protein ABI_16810 [Asticcacaulis biprosthecium C19]|uniref:Transmembrane protein n=1 Tax=Asticcacaulis biprosthecium C19 TaxID=715226 RepID=F4QJY4_9CAUL|nr:hypothetical protein [Asticcacaulis biprosthecium]EGF93241.1 hypothetical protein ABI_16810 [Asticcacaulis biprosthecium C19]